MAPKLSKVEDMRREQQKRKEEEKTKKRLREREESVRRQEEEIGKSDNPDHEEDEEDPEDEEPLLQVTRSRQHDCSESELREALALIRARKPARSPQGEVFSTPDNSGGSNLLTPHMAPLGSAYTNASSSISSDSGHGLGMRGARRTAKESVILNPEPAAGLPLDALGVNFDGLREILQWPHYAGVLTRSTTSCFYVRLENGQIQHLTEEINALTKLMLYWLAKDVKHINMKPEVSVVGFPDSDNYLTLFHSELELLTKWGQNITVLSTVWRNLLEQF